MSKHSLVRIAAQCQVMPKKTSWRKTKYVCVSAFVLNIMLPVLTVTDANVWFNTKHMYITVKTKTSKATLKATTLSAR